MNHSLLIVDSDFATGRFVSDALGRDITVDQVSDGHAGIARLQSRSYDVALIELGGQQATPLAVLAYALQHHKVRCALMLGAPHMLGEAVAAMRAGATDVIAKPLTKDAVRQSVLRAVGPVPAEATLASWRGQFAPEFIGEDPKILSLLDMIRRIAQTDCDVLITGASGTGKELIARCIHNASRRSKNPFVAINCAAIPKDLMESEIFGHSRGAFTGATERRSGKFEVAAGGTLFLDETGEMDLTLQSKFLRVIQEREVTPVGDSRTFKVNVRIVSATNQDLDNLRRDKLFREDLYYRLNVVPIHLPALQERPSDVPALAEHFIERANRRHGRHVGGLSPHAAQALAAYRWPGNVREMQNLIERVVILKNGEGPVHHEDLPPHIVATATHAAIGEVCLPERGLDINETLAGVETRLTLDALARARGNKARAAELLGLKRTTLVERLKKLNLESEQHA